MKAKTLIASSILLTSASAFAGTYPVTVTDVAGRTITIEHQPEKIALSTGRGFPLLEILYQKDSINHLVAWRDDMELSAPTMYASYLKDYPQLADMPKFGKIKTGEFDAERFIEQKEKPDLYLIDLANVPMAREKGLFKKLEDAGIQVMAIDFKDSPIKNTVQSVLSVAKAVNREEQGKAYANYYNSHLEAIQAVLVDVPATKGVFIERSAGHDNSCCTTVNDKNNMGTFLPIIKAHNVANPVLGHSRKGKMSPEAVIMTKPDIYIMQTIGWVNKDGSVSGGIPLGYNQDVKDIAKATERLMDRNWFKAVKGYNSKNVYSIYNAFYNSPYNLTAIEYFAKWVHPEVFKDLDPEATFEEMNAKLAGRKASGIFGINNFEAMN